MEHTQHKKRMMFPSIYSPFSFLLSRLVVVVVVVSPFFSPTFRIGIFSMGKKIKIKIVNGSECCLQAKEPKWIMGWK
jgi:hypothetical protein